MPRRGIAVITGGTGGLGVHVALGLARSFDLVLVARDAARAAAVRGRIIAQTPHASVTVALADLSLLGEAARAAREIAAAHPRIERLVLNAGAFEPERRLTAEGHERVIATNHLSPFVMTRVLGPLVAGRIVLVGSRASDRARIDPDDLEGARRWGLMHTYGQSKLALMMTGFEWAERLAPRASVAVVHPGLVATGLVKAGGAIGMVWSMLGRVSLSPEQGAAAPLRAALDPALEGRTGFYLKPSGIGEPNPRAQDAGLRARVWAATERLCGNHGEGGEGGAETHRATVAAEP